MNILPTYEDYSQILILGEADFSFTRAFAKELSLSPSPSLASIQPTKNWECNARKIEITATEYGNSADVTKRYFDDDNEKFSNTISEICDLNPIKEIACGVNARLLGDPINCPCERWNPIEKHWDAVSQFWEQDQDQDQDKNKNKIKARSAIISTSISTSTTTAFDLIIFNFPHSNQAGRAAKLIKALFKQIRTCIRQRRLPPTIVLEMRLRVLESDPTLKKNIRSSYKHEEAAEDSGFKLLGCWESDLHRWEKFDYQHKWTKRNASCRDVSLACKVWRWTPI